jgi:targeting protein for Xklp2
VKPPAQPVGFDLEIEKRIQEQESKKKSEDGDFKFHSRPSPTKIMEDVGVPEMKVLLITVHKSPAFSLKNRVQMLSREDEEEDEPVVIDRISSLCVSTMEFLFLLVPPLFKIYMFSL